MHIPLPPQFNMQPVVANVSQVRQIEDKDFKRVAAVTGDLGALQSKLDEIIKANQGAGIHTSVSLIDVSADRWLVTHNDYDSQFAASINKLPIALLLEHSMRAGEFGVNDSVSWSSGDVIGGYGNYDKPGAPTSATVGELITDMLTNSGNTAVRVLVNQKLGGPQNVNNRLAQYAEIPNTRLQINNSGGFYMGNTSSIESLWVLRQLLNGNDPYQQYMKEALRTNIFTDFGVRSQLAGSGYIVLANKVGILDDGAGNNRHDVGLIYNTNTGQTVGYSFLTTTPASGGSAQAQESLAGMGKASLTFADDTSAMAFNDNARMKTHGKGAAPATDILKPEKKILY